MMQANIKWLDDPRIFSVNQIKAHSDHQFYRNYDEWQRNNSSFQQSLNGRWQFNFFNNPQQLPDKLLLTGREIKNTTSILVPSEIELQGYAQNQYTNDRYPWEGKIYRRPAYILDKNDTQENSFSQGKDNTIGYYLKHFDLNPTLQNKNIRIRFERVERAFYVFLNNHFIGYAEDSFTPSEFDLSQYIKNKNNLLTVVVFKHSTASWLEDQDMLRFLGIFRNVELLATESTHLEDLDLRPKLNHDNQSGLLAAHLSFIGKKDGFIHIYVKDHNGKSLFDQQYSIENQLNIDNIPFKSVHPWSNHDPYLYQLFIEVYSSNSTLLELIPYQFGFRRIEINDQHVVLLNGKRLIINGVNRHEWDTERGRAITLDDMKQDIKSFQKNNINAVRTCHYPDQIPWYYMCDQSGIYVMAENNMETHGTWQQADYNVPGSSPEWLDAVIDRARNNYETLKNHTSILFWSLGNESYAGEDIAKMNEFYKSHDKSRLTHYEGVSWTPQYRSRISDIESRMYLPPKQVEDYLKNNPDKPFVECEYMHDMGNSCGGMGDYIKLLDQYPQYLGGFIWDYIDQALTVTDKISGQKVLRYGGDFDDHHTDNEFSGDGLMFANRT